MKQWRKKANKTFILSPIQCDDVSKYDASQIVTDVSGNKSLKTVLTGRMYKQFMSYGNQVKITPPLILGLLTRTDDMSAVLSRYETKQNGAQA